MSTCQWILGGDAAVDNGAEVKTRFISDPAGAHWAFEELVRGLNNSFPGGWPFLLVLLAVLISGGISYVRQGLGAAAFVLLPTLVSMLLIAGLAQFFLPRFLFSSVQFLMLVAVRGGFKLAAFFLPSLSRNKVLAIGALIALASASHVPAAWKPKQDFTAAANFMAEHRRPGDGVACVGNTYFPLAVYLGMECTKVSFLSDLLGVEKQHARTWLIYTLPKTIFFKRPDLWQAIQQRIQSPSEYQPVRTFNGTLGGGDIVVLLKQQNASGNDIDH